MSWTGRICVEFYFVDCLVFWDSLLIISILLENRTGNILSNITPHHHKQSRIYHYKEARYGKGLGKLFLKFGIILFVNCQDITGTGGPLLMINFRYEGEEIVNIELHSLNWQQKFLEDGRIIEEPHCDALLSSPFSA